jgi:hypothetical protein
LPRRQLNQFVEFTSIKPYASAVRAVVNLHTLPLGHKKGRVRAHWALHCISPCEMVQTRGRAGGHESHVNPMVTLEFPRMVTSSAGRALAAMRLTRRRTRPNPFHRVDSRKQACGNCGVFRRFELR